MLEITPTEATLVIDGKGQASVKFSLTLDDKNVDSLKATWEIFEKGQKLPVPDPDLGMITAFGEYLAPALPAAHFAKIRIRASAKDAGGTHYATAVVSFTLKWLPAWPYLAEPAWLPEAMTWNDTQGKRAALVLYDLLSQLPDDFLRAVENVPIIRMGALAASPFHFPLPAPFIVITNDSLQVIGDRTAGLPAGVVGEGEKETAYSFLHELSHAWMTDRCGGGLILTKGLWSVLHPFAELFAYQAGSVAAAIFDLPLLPIAIIWGLSNYVVNRRVSHDYMSDYAEQLGWMTNDLSAMSIPLLGLVWPWVGHEPPNVITAFRKFGGSALVNLRNPKLQEAQGKLSDPPTDAEVAAMLKATESVSQYGTEDPHEDWAESCCERAFGAAEINTFHYLFRSGYPDFEPINQTRRGFVGEAFPSDWKMVVVGAVLGNFDDWTVDYHPPEPPPLPPEKPAYKLLYEQLLKWEAGPAALIQKVQATLKDLHMPAERPTTLDFLRVAELHGDGLGRYHDTEQPAKPGDLIIPRDEKLRMVTKTDEQGRIVQVTGAAQIPPQANPSAFQLDRTSVIYQWRPSSKSRKWLKAGEQSSPAYADIEGTLTTLVGLWGMEETPQKKRVGSMGSFFVEALRVSRIEPVEFPLPAEPALRDIKGFCQTHGDGLRAFRPGAYPVWVGDWVLFYHENLWGVVTRVKDGVPVDVLVGGRIPPDIPALNTYQEVIGEGLDFAVKLLHEVDPRDIQWLWRPAAELRALSDTTNEVWEDLNRGLNNLLGHLESETILRGEKRMSYQVDPLLMLFWLMVEKGATEAARAAFREVSLSAQHDDDLWQYIYSHGDPTGRDAPAKPGDIISWLSGNAGRSGVVLETEQGAPTKIIGGEDRITLYEERVAPEKITDLWSPSFTLRRHEERDVAEFYGDTSILFELAAHASERKQLRRAGREFPFSDPHYLAQALAVNSPATVRDRIWETNDLEQLQEAVATYGEGLKDYEGQPLSIGAWCFLKSDRFAAVLTVSATGSPLTGLCAGSEGLIFEEVKTSEIRNCWLPSVKPFAYTDDASGGYADLNGLIGLLRFWGGLKLEMNHPLFGTSEFRDYLEPRLARFLKRGPVAEEDWPGYLAEEGELESPEGLKAGDFLLLPDNREAIALNDAEMLLRQNSRLYVRKVSRVGKRWRPGSLEKE